MLARRGAWGVPPPSPTRNLTNLVNNFSNFSCFRYASKKKEYFKDEKRHDAKDKCIANQLDGQLISVLPARLTV